MLWCKPICREMSGAEAEIRRAYARFSPDHVMHRHAPNYAPDYTSEGARVLTWRPIVVDQMQEPVVARQSPQEPEPVHAPVHEPEFPDTNFRTDTPELTDGISGHEFPDIGFRTQELTDKEPNVRKVGRPKKWDSDADRKAAKRAAEREIKLADRAFRKAAA
jgi:hypothetical protein